VKEGDDLMCANALMMLRHVTRDGTLDVRTHLGGKCTQLGGSPPDFLASILMREINSSAKCDDSC
jgi:hypothetical protein